MAEILQTAKSLMEHSGKVLGKIMIQGFAGKCEIKLCSQALHNLYGRGTELLSLGMVSFLSISLTLSVSVCLSLSVSVRSFYG